MSRKDTAAWQSATTVVDLGQLTARWLEGQLGWHPWYETERPNEETTELIPALGRVNRAGFFTTDSQPGRRGRGFNGRLWEQRAFVGGFVADQKLLKRLKAAAGSHGCQIDVRSSRRARAAWIEATRADGEWKMAGGGAIDAREITHEWQDLNPVALAALIGAQQVSIVHPEWGPASTQPFIRTLSAI